MAAGVDTFDCVMPSRVARNAALYTRRGRFNVNTAPHRRAFEPIEPDCDCYTCGHFTRAYLHHLFKAKEFLGSTLLTLHNLAFVVRLVDEVRAAMAAGPDEYVAYKEQFLGRYYSGR